MHYVMPAMEPVGLSVDGREDLFPVARVFCIGRNYASHAIEMGGNPEREEPFSFGKPATATVPNGGPLGYPPTTGDLHHEVELVIALDVNGVRRQSGKRNQMIWKTEEAISLLSGLLELRSGDILFTGTQAASHVGID